MPEYKASRLKKSSICVVITVVAILSFAIAEKIEPSRLAHYRINTVLFGGLPLLRNALELYFENEGKYPDSLSKLLPGNESIGYVDKLPTDGWGNQYIYRKTTSGFQLYSAGVDGIDDDQLGDDVIGTEKEYQCESYRSYCPISFLTAVKLVSLVTMFAVILFVFGYAMYYLTKVINKYRTHTKKQKRTC